MKTGIINYNLSIESIALAKKINEMKKTKTYDQIAVELGYTRPYVIALNKEFQTLKSKSPQMIKQVDKQE